MQLAKSAAAVLAAVVAWGTAGELWAQPAATATPRRPIMEALDQMGVAKTLDEWHLTIGGRVEGSWTYNFNDPDSEVNPGRIFDFEHNEPILNQLALNVERKVDPAQKNFDVGGKAEGIWGADSGLIHANGLTDWYDGPRDPENQLDLTQLYVDVAIPVGNGLLLRVGKFVTIIGQEVIDPEGNMFYSHSFLFVFAQPLTHTGIIASYNLTDDWSITGGITRGWDQAFEDNNDAIDFLGGVKWVLSKDTTAILNISMGPQRTDNDDDWRYLFDIIISHIVSDQLSLAANIDIGYEEEAAVSPVGDAAYFWGLALYAGYKLNDNLTLNGRGEWFKDDSGARTGLDGLNLYEFTVGLNIKPLPKDRWGQYLQIRPEIRWDLAGDEVFDDFQEDNQLTFGVDVVYGL